MLIGNELSTQLVVLISLAFLAMAIVLIFIAIRNSLEESRRIKNRLEDVVVQPDRGVFRKKKVLEHLGNYISLPDDDEITRIKFELMQAGFYSGSAVKTYFAARLISLVIPQFLILGFWGKMNAQWGMSTSVFLACVATVIGLMLPQVYIRLRRNKRTDQVRKGFPDMMDLLVACIEAGLSLNAGLIRVGDEIGGRYPALKNNLDVLNLELRAGRESHEGMQTFANRVNLDEAKALAVMIKQSEEMGASMGATLRNFSNEMRHKRLMKAEEKALALSAKLTVPLILFIFPTIMVMLLLPAGIRMSEGLFS